MQRAFFGSRGMAPPTSRKTTRGHWRFSDAHLFAPDHGLARETYTRLVGKLDARALLFVLEAAWWSAPEEDKERIGKRFLEALSEHGETDWGKQVLEAMGIPSDAEAPSSESSDDEKQDDIFTGNTAADGVEWFAQDPSSPRLSQIVEHLSAEEEGTLLLEFCAEVEELDLPVGLGIEVRLIHSSLLEPAPAIERLEWILEKRPKTVSVLQTLVERTRQLNNSDSLVHALQRLISASSFSAEKEALEREQAVLLWRDLGRLEEAVPVFRKWRVREPHGEEVLEFFADLARSRSDWSSLLRNLRRIADSASEPRAEARYGFACGPAEWSPPKMLYERCENCGRGAQTTQMFLLNIVLSCGKARTEPVGRVVGQSPDGGC